MNKNRVLKEIDLQLENHLQQVQTLKCYETDYQLIKIQLKPLMLYLILNEARDITMGLELVQINKGLLEMLIDNSIELLFL